MNLKSILKNIKIELSQGNLNRTISACIVAQKQISKSFDLKKSKKFCEQEIKKMN